MVLVGGTKRGSKVGSHWVVQRALCTRRYSQLCGYSTEFGCLVMPKPEPKPFSLPEIGLGLFVRDSNLKFLALVCIITVLVGVVLTYCYATQQSKGSV